MSALDHANAFVARWNGKYIDEDRQYGSQCWDVVARYAREEYGCPSFPTISGGAEGLWRFYANPIPKFFDKVPREALAAGDIAVWDASFYPPFGHTALVWLRSGGTIFVLEQDGSKDPNHDGIADGVSYIAHRDITIKLAGGLRPKGGNMPASADKVDETTVRLAYNGVLFRDASDAEVKQWVGSGVTVEGFYRTLLSSSEYAKIRGQWEAGKGSKLKPYTGPQLYTEE